VIRGLAVAALLALAGGASAQSVEDLQRQLKERDAKIRELSERIEALEKKAEPDDELNRALERTLVQQGALLLRQGVYEVQPQLGYSHWDKDRSALHHQTDLSLGARVGLPWDAQFQVRVPYVHVATAAGSATALGDIDLALSRQLGREDGYWPGTFVALGWTSRTGRDGFDGSVPTGGGFNVLQAALTAVKRQDPMVYYGTLSYADPRARVLEGSRVDPGSTTGLRFGGILAATPETSISLGVDLGFVGDSRVDGQPVPGTDAVLGTLQIGFAAIVTRSLMFSLNGDFRFSGNVPNFRLTLALPIRF